MINNVPARIFALFDRFLCVRGGKNHIWKDGRPWELKLEQFVLFTHAYNFAGCRYNFSINELMFNVIKNPLNSVLLDNS